jgi:hypothetical protein
VYPKSLPLSSVVQQTLLMWKKGKALQTAWLDEVKSSITENILKNVFNPFGGFQ